MKFFFKPIFTPGAYSILPAIEFGILRCENPDCHKIHGYELGIRWLDFGVAAVLLLAHDDLT
jgi:hypothetical protein